jgi:hypothetical protein
VPCCGSKRRFLFQFSGPLLLTPRCQNLRPCRKAALVALLIRELGYPRILDVPYALAKVLDEDPVSATLVNSYLLEQTASGRERINRHRAIAQLRKQMFEQPM